MLFFIDESGHDRGFAPYEVLAGVAINERDLWNFIQAVRKLELEYFGMVLSSVGIELKGGKLLKNKAFRLARQGPPIDKFQRQQLAKTFLEKGWSEHNGGPLESRSTEEYTAYGQSVLEFVVKLLDLSAAYRIKTFAAVVDKNAPRLEGSSVLRKDYSYLFERFFYYLEDIGNDEMGLIVFDELEKAQSRILLNQMDSYFRHPGKGSQRSAKIVPEPFFVHSDLTTLVQLADIVGYCLNWGGRFNQRMTQPIRTEIKQYADVILRMQYRGKRMDDMGLREWDTYGIFFLDDLRPRQERE